MHYIFNRFSPTAVLKFHYFHKYFIKNLFQNKSTDQEYFLKHDKIYKKKVNKNCIELAKYISEQNNYITFCA